MFIFTAAMSLGDKIRKHRTEKGLTQAELADKTGIYQKNVSDYEKNLVMPSASMMKKIADVLGVSLDYIMGEEQQVIKDTKLLKYAREVDELDLKDKEFIMKVLAALLKDIKLKKLFWFLPGMENDVLITFTVRIWYVTVHIWYIPG